MEEQNLPDRQSGELERLMRDSRAVLASMDDFRRRLDRFQIELYEIFPLKGKIMTIKTLEEVRQVNNDAYEILGYHPFSPLTDFRPVEEEGKDIRHN